ncbi:MAG: efflux RND transporter periplasmic adaptor subunit [Gemmatimonadetes bacterium]|nr:efflux RND transporter periplasmic adaptor subunit [Gemmatimonadota bacterium]
MFRLTIARACGALLVLAGGACNREEASGAPPGGGGGGGAAPAAQGKAGGGAPGGPGGGRAPTVLGPTDVLEVTNGSIEAVLLISGDLKPIEEIAVRARMEGDVTAVLAREGDRVTRGQVLVRFENAVQEGDRASAQAEVESSKADVANAQWNADQSAELFKAGAIPERDLRTAQQTLAASQSRLAAADARLRGVAQVLEDTRLGSPTTGVVSTRAVEPGEHVTRGATLMTVVRNDVLELEAAVPSRQAAELRAGQAVKFAANGRQLEGKVARISPTINPANRTLTVYLQVPNPRGEMRGNTFATGRVVTKRVDNTIVIPAAALRQSATGGQSFVYRIVDDKVDVAQVELGVGDEQAATAQVLSGLAVGDRIIVGNLGALGRGMPVRVVSAEQGRGGGAREAGATGARSGANGGTRPSRGGDSTSTRRPPGDAAAKR